MMSILGAIRRLRFIAAIVTLELARTELAWPPRVGLIATLSVIIVEHHLVTWHVRTQLQQESP